MEIVHLFFRGLSENCFIILIFLLSYKKDFAGFYKLLALTIGLSSSSNTFLKELWQVLLGPSLGKVWWTFPNWYMQNAAIFYLGLALYTKKLWVFIVAIIILYGISECFIHYKFHYAPKMIAAVNIALILLTIMDLVYEFNKRYEVLAPIYGIAIVIILSWIIFFNLTKKLTYYSWLFITLSMSLATTITINLFSYYDLYTKCIILNKKLDILIAISFCLAVAFITQAFKLIKELTPHTLILYFFASFTHFFSIIYLVLVVIVRFNFLKKKVANAI